MNRTMISLHFTSNRGHKGFNLIRCREGMINPLQGILCGLPRYAFGVVHQNSAVCVFFIFTCVASAFVSDIQSESLERKQQVLTPHTLPLWPVV